MPQLRPWITTTPLIISLLMSCSCSEDPSSTMIGGEVAGERFAGEEPAGEEPAGAEPAGEGPAGEEPAGEEPAGEEPAGAEPAGEGPAGEEPAGEEPAGEEPAGEGPAGAEPAGEGPAGAEPAGEEPAGVEPAGEEPAGEDPAGEMMFELPYLEVLIDRPLLGQAIQGFSLEITCVYRDSDGSLLPTPEDMSATIDSESALFNEGRWSFSDYGTYTARCASEGLSLSAERQIVVYFEGVDHRFQQNISSLYSAGALYSSLIQAFTIGDEAGRQAALNNLRALSNDLPSVTEVAWIAPHPLQAWPEAADLTMAGLSPSPDDALWSQALQAFSVEVEADYQWWLNLSPSELTDADLEAVLTRRATLDQLADNLAELEVSPWTAWTERHALGAVMRRLTETAQLTHQVIIDFYESAPLPEPNPSGFTVGELMTSIVVQGVLDAASETAEGLNYHRMLFKVGLTAAASFAQVVLREYLNLNLEINEGAPVISSIHGPAGGFMGAGNSYQVFGTFPGGPQRTVFLIIPPRYTQVLAQLYELLDSLNDVRNTQKIVLKAQEIERLIRLIIKAPEIIESLGSITRSQELLNVTPSQGNQEHLFFPPLPSGLNCSFFMIPAAGTVIPINTLTGVGEAVNVNFYGESDDACE